MALLPNWLQASIAIPTRIAFFRLRGDTSVGNVLLIGSALVQFPFFMSELVFLCADIIAAHSFATVDLFATASSNLFATASPSADIIAAHSFATVELFATASSDLFATASSIPFSFPSARLDGLLLAAPWNPLACSRASSAYRQLIAPLCSPTSSPLGRSKHKSPASNPPTPLHTLFNVWLPTALSHYGNGASRSVHLPSCGTLTHPHKVLTREPPWLRTRLTTV